ncbi:MAG: hypothetical protein RLZ75_9 [Pseudomonadota bacterium]
MAAPLFKKNTLEQTGFKLLNDGFIYSGINYKFEDVLVTGAYRSTLETKHLMIGSDFTHSISIIFKMQTGETVQVTEQPTWLSNSKLEKVEQIQNIFNIVSEKTFQNRVNKYLTQVEKQGFFEYAGWLFYPEQKKIIDNIKKRAYSIKTTTLLKGYGYIQVKSEADGIGTKINNYLISGYPVISTLENTDVFFALLKHFFDFEWKH